MQTNSIKTKTAALGLSQHPVVFWSLFVALVSLAIAYVWLIKVTIDSVIERKQLSSANSSLSQTIAPLESQYLALSREITLVRAHALGFVDVPRVEYAQADAPKTVLSRN